MRSTRCRLMPQLRRFSGKAWASIALLAGAAMLIGAFGRLARSLQPLAAPAGRSGRQPAAAPQLKKVRWRNSTTPASPPMPRRDARLLPTGASRAKVGLHLLRPGRLCRMGQMLLTQGRCRGQQRRRSLAAQRFGLFGPPGIIFTPAAADCQPARGRLHADRCRFSAERRRLIR